ncbi:hypothetical protein RUMOBE_04065 [Blautia obeum ATCC 29174]|uniref:Uncharacterized protein n=1 Tax=Blautia obeum ATCC 29174 TaxID=411459 RepID=A5ZYF5_9FIRM|nr:hypothetical protein RUMOBE_04065 [Blautia obeum ATCC 29174]
MVYLFQIKNNSCRDRRAYWKQWIAVLLVLIFFAKNSGEGT